MTDFTTVPTADDSADRSLCDALYTRIWHRPGCGLKFLWNGVLTGKSPADIVQYQEIIVEHRPEFIIETGTAFGGSALFLASICDMVGTGHVVTVDIDGTRVDSRVRSHPRITCLTGDSCQPHVMRGVAALAGRSERTMVILDSAHDAAHVEQELMMYSLFVGLEQYLIVEDGTVNGHPILPDFGPGPFEALERFFARPASRRFVNERDREVRFGPSNVRNGFLRRVE